MHPRLPFAFNLTSRSRTASLLLRLSSRLVDAVTHRYRWDMPCSGSPVSVSRNYSNADRTWKSSQGINFAPSSDQACASARPILFAGSRSISDTSTTEHGRLASEQKPAPLRTTGASTARFAPLHGESSRLPNDTTWETNQKSLKSVGGLGIHASPMLASSDLSMSTFSQEHDPIYPLLAREADSHWETASNLENADRGRSKQGNGVEGVLLDEKQPFRTPLGFHIPQDTLQSALNASPQSQASYWRSSLYRGPSGDNQRVKVHYCKTKNTSETVAQLFLNEEVIGLDIEWIAQARMKDAIWKNVSLIQLASEERVALFHIARYPGAKTVDDFVAPTMKKILESQNITKAGVAIKGDATRLLKHLDIRCRGLFELSHLYKVVKYYPGNTDKINRICVSLAQQVEEHLQLPLQKGAVQMSDWTKDLDHSQTQYAASDSYANFQLYHRMEAKRRALDPVPPRPAHADLDQDASRSNKLWESPLDESLSSALQSIVDPTSNTDVSVAELASKMCDAELSSNASFEDSSSSPSLEFRTASILPSSTSTLGPRVVESPELNQANEWVASYTKAHFQNRKSYLTPSSLRAYALWHEQKRDVPDVASILRDPPLKNSTVIDYICQSVLTEKLPTSTERLAKLLEYNYKPFRKMHETLLETAAQKIEKSRQP